MTGAEPLEETYVAERARTEALRIAVVRGLSGRNLPFVLDADPTSRFCVGVLTPATVDSDERRAQRRARRKPDALGFAARVTPDGRTIEGEVAISFALYHREVPTFEEQQPTPEVVDLAGTQRLRQKYCRTEVRVDCLPFRVELPAGSSVAGVSFDAANARVVEHLAGVMREIAADPACWPGGAEVRVPRADLLDEGRYHQAVPRKSPELPAWRVVLDGRLVSTGDGWRLTVLLQNRTGDGTPHPAEVFDARVEVSLSRGQFASEPFVAAARDYRYETVSWGRGINAVLEVANDGRRAWSETLPVYEQQRTRSTGSGLGRACETAVLAGEGTLGALSSVSEALAQYATRWLAANEQHITDSTGHKRNDDLAHFRAEAERFTMGIAALQADPRLLRAFCLANQAAARRGLQSWRLFQLVFVVSILPSLLARERPDDLQLRAELDIVDVLWFPTGGGKTEASFGVILTAMFYDRLRGKARGTTAWLRYPLRMLSIQQLQRLTDFVVAADAVRVEELGAAGGDPFVVGYYVGADNTPNELSHNSPPHPIQQYAQDAAQNGGDAADLRVLQRCPFCGTPKPRVEVDDSISVLRIHHRCQNPACGRVAPIVISDSEIYRYAPTILVGTVDRLARAGQTSYFAHLFGQFDQICAQHGYVSFGQCVEGACAVRPGTFKRVDTVYDPTPALLLQDELHLLRESLGTYDAHFEGFLDVTARTIGSNLPTKRLAATATIEGYQKHVRELYGRDARRFPEKGMEEFDSAYAVPDEGAPVRRVYVGILPFGVDSDEVAARVAEIAEEAAGTYWASDEHDPLIASRYDLALVYANQKNTAGNIGARLNSRLLVKVLTGDRSLDEVRAAIDQIEGDAELPYADRLKVLIATSLISHGVDLNRLNIMAFVGFPGRAADYIQSSSRVGRDNVGLVFTIFDPVDNLNRSTYLHFHEYHERLYQLVQPVPISRFSETSVKRTFNGIYAAILLNVLGPQRKREGLLTRSLQRGAAAQSAYDQGILRDDDVIGLIEESYGIAHHGLPTEVVDRLRSVLRRRARSSRQNIETNEEWAMHQRLRPPPVPSLRDVEDQIEFRVRYQSRDEVDQVGGY
jgi:hypothetical protein